MFIKGEKVLLRAIELSDAGILRQMMNDEDVEKMMWGYSFPVSEHQQVKWIENISNEKNDKLCRCTYCILGWEKQIH